MTDFPCSGSYRAHKAGESGNPYEPCAECGEHFVREDMPKVGRYYVCKDCEPLVRAEMADEGEATPAPSESPTEAFLRDLRAIYAVDPIQAVADLAHDQRTEGFAKRPFRTNPHDN